jgi:oxygen-dependent protoporphyrinogen oxidase
VKRVVVVGGGVAGLSAAYYLQRSKRVSVTVLEASVRFGGKLGTFHEYGLTVEQTADSIFTGKPAARDLIIELGLEDQLIEPLANSFSMLISGHLHVVPRALATLRPTPESLESVEFLSGSEKARALEATSIVYDEAIDVSVGKFFRAKFGPRFSELVVEPLLAGIHAGSPEKLSMRALFPSYMRQRSESPSASALDGTVQPSGPAFLGLAGGMGSLIERLEQRLDGATLRTSSPVVSLGKDGSSIDVHLESGDPIKADHVVLAVPSYVAAKLMRPLRAEVAELLGEIRHVSTAVVTMAFDEAQFPQSPKGNGFLVPYTEPRGVTGCTITSNKWSNRAPESQVLLRAFMGRDGELDIDGKTDEELTSIAREEIKSIYGADRPRHERLDRWTNAMPQYDLNHLDRISDVEDLLTELPISLAGGSYRGTGIPDCVRQGFELATRILGTSKR